jgi:hypothetical protein
VERTLASQSSLRMVHLVEGVDVEYTPLPVAALEHDFLEYLRGETIQLEATAHRIASTCTPPKALDLGPEGDAASFVTARCRLIGDAGWPFVWVKKWPMGMSKSTGVCAQPAV